MRHAIRFLARWSVGACWIAATVDAHADNRLRGMTSQLMAAGYSHFVLIPSAASSGFTWGTDTYGELGNGSTTSPAYQANFLDVNSYAGIGNVAAGGYFSIAVDISGNLWGWGKNDRYQAGYSASTAPVTSPTQITSGAAPWKRVGAGYNHACAINGSGALYCWGDNAEGELGQGTTNSSPTTTFSSVGSSTWLTVAGGDQFTAGIQANGSAWTWGLNSSGQLGTGNTGSYDSTPAAISTSEHWVAISAGMQHAMAIRDDGTLWVWGSNTTYGQLGNGTTTGSSSTPVQVTKSGGWTSSVTSTAGSWIAVAAGGYDSFAILSDGTLWSWGSNSHGQLGINSTLSVVSTPTQVADLGGGYGYIGYQYIAAGLDFTIGLTADGDVYTWGNDGSGQLGNGHTSSSATSVPTRVPDTPDISYYANKPGVLAAGPGSGSNTYDGAYIRSSGELETWGYNTNSALGLVTSPLNQFTNAGCTGTPSVCWAPVPVVYETLSGSTVVNPSPWTHVATGLDATFAVRSDGTLWAWGTSGNGTSSSLTVPTNIPTPASGVPWLNVFADVSEAQAFGVLANGTLWTWLNSATPSQLCTSGSCNGKSWVSIAAAGSVLGVTTDGGLWGWGSDAGGELLQTSSCNGLAAPTPLDSSGGAPSSWSSATWLDTEIKQLHVEAGS